jgi:uncharacterized protein YndB with AHSA1/START domain
MMSIPESVVVSATCMVPAERGAVWDALIRTEQREQWWPGFDLAAHVGGMIEESWRDDAGVLRHTRGAVRRVNELIALEFEWIDEDWRQPSVVHILLDDTAVGTRVTVTEFGLAEVSDNPAVFGEHRQGWEMHLSDLTTFLGGRA